MSLKSAAITVIALISIGLFFSLVLIKSGKTEDSYTSLNTDLVNIIKSKGVPYSVNKIETALNNKIIDINQCHNLLHIVGHAAYEFYPNDWTILISPKSDICFYGFEHGVEAQIVLERSSDTSALINKLHEYCQKFRDKFEGAACYHGVGHAYIQEGMAIASALNGCDKVMEASDDPSDCYRGAYSEYVNRLRGIDGDTDAPIPNVTPKVIDKKHVYDECLSLPNKYQKSCAMQFTAIVYDGQIEDSLSNCNSYPDWLSEICAFKVSEADTSTYFEQQKYIIIPKAISLSKQSVIKGYIDGVLSGYRPFQKEDLNDSLKIWCKKLPNPKDTKYCLDNTY